MELEIYNILNENEELLNLLGGKNIFSVFAGKYKGNALICKWVDNRHTYERNKSSLSIDSYSASYEMCVQIKELLYKILLQGSNLDFIQLGNYWENIMLAGNSGPLWDQTVEQFTLTINFVINWRAI